MCLVHHFLSNKLNFIYAVLFPDHVLSLKKNTITPRVHLVYYGLRSFPFFWQTYLEANRMLFDCSDYELYYCIVN